MLLLRLSEIWHLSALWFHIWFVQSLERIIGLLFQCPLLLVLSFMLFADTVGRTINAPYETPVAAIVAIMGLPFFLFIVRKGGKAFS